MQWYNEIILPALGAHSAKNMNRSWKEEALKLSAATNEPSCILLILGIHACRAVLSFGPGDLLRNRLWPVRLQDITYTRMAKEESVITNW